MTELSERSPDDVENLLLDLLDDVRSNQVRLREEMHSGLANSPGAGANPLHIGMARELASAAIALSREARAWAKQARDLGKKLTREQRLELMLQFVRKLGPNDRRNLAKQILEIP